jgi:hypothetical protein
VTTASKSLVFVAVALLSAAACKSSLEHAFGGYAYDSTNDCLQTSGVLDVVAGSDPGPCPMVRCWQAPCGTVVVTSTACDAPPDYQDLTDASTGPCVKALAAYAAFADAGTGMCPASLDASSDASLGCGLP